MGNRKLEMSDMLQSEQLNAEQERLSCRFPRRSAVVLGCYLDGLAEAPDGPILHRRNEVG